MTTRYYEERECGTCRGTGWIPDDPDGWDVPDMSMSGCPDCQPGIGGTGVGQRRELTDVEVLEWCETHVAESIQNHDGPSDECWRVVWADKDDPEGVGFPYELCRIVSRAIIPLESADG